jgi:hypothetical protein
MHAEKTSLALPPAGQIRRAVELYLARAYSAPCPAPVAGLIPPEDFDPCQWLMDERFERDPADAPLAQVRSFILRLGNDLYPHMKLRISRPPRAVQFVFSVDSHDAFLHASPGSKDYELLEELKRHNAALAESIHAAWDLGGLPTERNYLRQKLQEAKDARERKP